MPEPMFRIVATSRQPGTCRSCQAPITWAKTFPNEKAHPLERDAVALKTEHDSIHGTIDYVASADSHFANCPQSSRWSKK